MSPKKPFVPYRDLVEAMAACLRVMLIDLRSRRYQLTKEVERLERMGVRVDSALERIGDPPVNGEYPANQSRRTSPVRKPERA